jgi:hypothetical protein
VAAEERQAFFPPTMSCAGLRSRSGLTHILFFVGGTRTAERSCCEHGRLGQAVQGLLGAAGPLLREAMRGAYSALGRGLREDGPGVCVSASA